MVLLNYRYSALHSLRELGTYTILFAFVNERCCRSDETIILNVY